MTEEQVRGLLNMAVTNAGGQRAWAKAHGFSAAYVNDVLKGRRALADNICSALGITRKVTFVIEYEKGRKS